MTSDLVYETKLRGLTKWVFGAFIAGAVLSLGLSGLELAGQTLDPNWHDVDAPYADATVESIVFAQAPLVVAFFLVYVFGIVAFLKWQYRVAKRTRTYADHIADKTPAWTVGWWFVPFANLVMPYRVISRLFVANDPGAAVGERGEAPGKLLGVYWTLWLFSNYLSNVSFKLYMGKGASDYDAAIRRAEVSTWMDLAISVVDIVLVVVTVRWMARLRDWHLAKLDQVASQAAPGDPPGIRPI
ncbi:MAG: DUF4328 domain-containing protein [Planctomycetota bacterium]